MAKMAWQGTLVLVAVDLLCAAVEPVLGAKRVSITDDLRDVVDDDWHHWGAPAREPPPDLSRVDPAAVQAELLRRHAAPSLGFVKLRLGVPRSREDVVGIATRWSNVLRTGSVAAKFVAVDFGTLMFTTERGQDVPERWRTLLRKNDQKKLGVLVDLTME